MSSRTQPQIKNPEQFRDIDTRGKDFSIIRRNKPMTVKSWMMSEFQSHFSGIQNPQVHSKAYNSTL